MLCFILCPVPYVTPQRARIKAVFLRRPLYAHNPPLHRGLIRDQRKFEASPSITLKGRWMAALGFETDQKIEVITGPGQLIIRLTGEK